MTDLNKLIVIHYDDEDSESNIELVDEISPGYGYKAFCQNTPEDQLNGFDLSLRKLMKSIKSYTVSVQLCKQIRKLDRKHIAWVNKTPGIITL